MKKRILAVAGISATTIMALAGCNTSAGTEKTVIIYNQDMQEVRRITTDNAHSYSDNELVYTLKGEKHIVNNTPYEIIEKVVDEDDE